MLPKLDEIVTGPPAFSPVASPVALIVASAGLEEVQETTWVRSFVLPSEYKPVAWNCKVAPTAMEEVAGDCVMELSVTAGGSVAAELAPEEPQPVKAKLKTERQTNTIISRLDTAGTNRKERAAGLEYLRIVIAGDFLEFGGI
jgi:hypothetical protein